MLKFPAMVVLFVGCVAPAQPAADPLAEGVALLEKGLAAGGSHAAVAGCTATPMAIRAPW